MTNGLIFMTALLPTIGHEYLINFAANYVDSVHCIISTRSHEPTTFYQRMAGMNVSPNVYFYHHDDDEAPQSPVGENDNAFWEYWEQVVDSLVDEDIDYVFASELYGKQVADTLGAEFIPVDCARSAIPTKGTSVRENLFYRQAEIATDFKELLKLDVVLFGPESCGKTTMARRLARNFEGTFLPEWARPYLETVGPQITEHKMRMIVHGQYASERAAEHIDRLLTFKDTDLLSTLGFYELYGISKPPELQWMIDDYPNDLYIVMNDSIPFEPDQLRYGVTKRETNVQYWIDILERYKRKYYVVESSKQGDQYAEIWDCIVNYKLDANKLTYKNLFNFQRD